MKYHLYQRTITRNGKKFKAWYYWFYDSNQKQVRKSCGSDGKPCLKKKDAESFIAKLPDSINSEKLTFNQFCTGFYDQDSKYMKKLLNRGVVFHDTTLKSKKRDLEKFLKRFGDVGVKDIVAPEIEDWLLELDIGNSARNMILCIFDEIERELYSYHYIDYKVVVEHFRRNTKEKGTLSISEIKRLFPDDFNELINVWRISNVETEFEIYNFAAMIYTMVSTGMRSSEIRALQWNQVISNGEAILINAMVDSNGERVNHLKKWTHDDNKWRVTVLPDKTRQMLNMLKLLQDIPTEYVFTHYGDVISRNYLLQHFKLVMKKNGIDCLGRNITIHSLRFTYNTLMRKEISGEDLRLMMGHTSEKMTDYYDKSQILDHLPGLLNNRNSINNIFN